jgi:ATP-dependent DNA ligase
VCKLRDASYRSGARASWLKIKCFKREVFPIIGFIPAAGAIAVLHLARREGKRLAYAGRAREFTQKGARELRQALDELATDWPPVRGAPAEADVNVGEAGALGRDRVHRDRA